MKKSGCLSSEIQKYLIGLNQNNMQNFKKKLNNEGKKKKLVKNLDKQKQTVRSAVVLERILRHFMGLKISHPAWTK